MVGLRPSHLSALLHGARNISPQLANRIESVLGIPANVWLNLQNNYNLDIIRTSDLVEGYSVTQNSRAYALAQPSNEDTILWNTAYRSGEKDMADKVMSILTNLNIDKEQLNRVSKSIKDYLSR